MAVAMRTRCGPLTMAYADRVQKCTKFLKYMFIVGQELLLHVLSIDLILYWTSV